MRIAIAIVALALLAGCRHDDREAVRPTGTTPGERLMYRVGCLQCHTFRGQGAQNFGAPDLTHEGRRKRGVAWQIAKLRCPQCKTPDSPMPPYAELGERNLRELAVFLESLD